MTAQRGRGRHLVVVADRRREAVRLGTAMRDDPVIAAVREVRHRISQSVGHDPQRLVAYYRQRQEDRRNRPARRQPDGADTRSPQRRETKP